MHDVPLGMGVRSAGARSGRRSRSAMGACRLSAGSVRVTPRFVDACAAPRRGAPRFGSFRVAALFFQTRGEGTEKDTVAMRAITLGHSDARPFAEQRPGDTR